MPLFSQKNWPSLPIKMGDCINMSATSFTESSPPNVTQKPALSLLSRSELLLLMFVLAISVASLAATAARRQAVEWSDFLPGLGFCLSVVLIGIIIRKTRHLGRTATGIIALGLFWSFFMFYGVLTFTVLPFSNPMVDQQLLAADAAIGLSWVESVNFLAGYPTVAFALRFVYVSLLPQLVFVIILLASLRQQAELHRFIMVGFLSCTASVGIWWLFPSVGPAAYAMVSEEVQQKVFLVANAEYGEKMWRYATEGNQVISASKMAGVVAFPSMHIVLTGMILWFTRRTYMFIPLLVFNFVVPVATYLQGGHHFMDLIGGLILFCVCVGWADRLLRDSDAVSTQPSQLC